MGFFVVLRHYKAAAGGCFFLLVFLRLKRFGAILMCLFSRRKLKVITAKDKQMTIAVATK